MNALYVTKRSVIYYLLLILALTCLILNGLGILDLDIDIEGLIVVGISSVFCIVFIGMITMAPSERIVLLIGYIVRLLWLYVDIYKNIVLTGGGSDANAFWANAIGRYHGLVVPELTKYPYLIKVLLWIFGENRLLAQYVNIWAWLFSALVLYKCLHLLDVRSKRIRLIGIVCLCFLPEYIFLSSTLMRESFIVLLNLVSLYYFLKWFQKQKFSDIFLAEFFILLSMVLHSGAIGLGAAYGISYALYDKKRRKIRISLKTIIIGLLGFVGIFVIFVSSFRSAALAYLPKMNNLFTLQGRWFDETGGSNYLRNMPYTENMIVFGWYTIVRTLYFYVSPVPWEWRGMKDIFAFCVDSLFHIISIVFGIFYWKKDKGKRKLIGFLLLCILMFGLVFAWGVSNAGTAMRHRCKVVGIEVVLIGVCMRRKNTGNKKDKKYRYHGKVKDFE